MKLILVHYLFLFFVFCQQEDRFRKYWDFNKNIEIEFQPRRINDTNYDTLVVDPKTNTVIGEKPWFIFFYYNKCGICQNFKVDFDQIAYDLKDIANFAYIEVMSNELLKETYQIKHSPFFVLLKGNKYYFYENARKTQAIQEYIQKDHLQSKKTGDIPSKVTTFDIFMIYCERYLE